MSKLRQILAKLNLEENDLNELEDSLNGFIDEEKTGLKNKNSELLGKLSKIKGLDVDLLLEQQKDNEVNDYIKHIKDGTAKEFIEQIRASERQKVEQEFSEAISGKDKELAGWQEKFTDLQTSNDRNLIKDTLRKQLSEIPGINREYIDDIISFAEKEMEVVEENGSRQALYKGRSVKTKDNTPSEIKDWFAKDAKGWMYENTGGTGSGGKQNAAEDIEFEDMDADDLLDEFGL